MNGDSPLAKITPAAIEQIETPGEAARIANLAEAARKYAKKARLGLDVQNHAAELKIRAERKAGELLITMAKNGQRQLRGYREGISHDAIFLPTLADLNILPDQSSRWQRIARIRPDVFEARLATILGTPDTELGSAVLLKKGTDEQQAKREAKRDHRRQLNAEKAATTPDLLAAGVCFPTILVDPPWDWGDEGDVNQMGRAKPDYATLSLDQLLSLPVGKFADSDAHLYLWITNRSLPKGFSLLECWGFRYVTCLTWVKPHYGMGNYFRGQTEHILFGVKGSQPLKRKDVGTVFHAERGPNRHSSKPSMIYDLIESCSPGPYLELFSRINRSEWSAWGADAP